MKEHILKITTTKSPVNAISVPIERIVGMNDTIAYGVIYLNNKGELRIKIGIHSIIAKAGEEIKFEVSEGIE